MTPWDVASLESRGLIGRIYVGDHYTLLLTQYISCGPHGFREEDFLSFSHYKSMGANGPRGMASLDPRGLICLFVLPFYRPVNLMGSCRARSVYLTTHLLGKSLWELMTPGAWPVWTPGA